MKSLIALALFVASSEALIQCLPDACARVNCLAATPCNGKFVKGGGECGCCDSCVNLLGKYCDISYTVLCSKYKWLVYKRLDREKKT